MSKVFFGGVPTQADVRKINEAFPNLQEGDEISHEQIEQVLGYARTSNRYRTVTGAWRRQLLNDNGQEVGALAGVGFRCLKPDERISGSVKSFQSGTRKQMRAVRKAVVVRTEDPQLRRKQDLMRRFGAAIYAEASSMMKEIEPPHAHKQLPRRAPGAGAGGE